MAQHATQNKDYFGSSDGSPIGREKEKLPFDDGTRPSAPAYPDDVYDDREGEVVDPYGGKKLGMVRVSPAALREISANISRQLWYVVVDLSEECNL